MSDERQPQWHRGIDRWVLIVGAGLAVIAGIGIVSSLRKPPATPTPAPTVIAEGTTAPASPEAVPGTELPVTPTAGEATPVGVEATPAVPGPSGPEGAEVANLGEGAVLVAEAPGSIRGVAPPGATVTIAEDGVILGQTTADDNGNWQIDLPALPPGQHELTVAATDAGGQPLGEPQTLAVASVPADSITAPIINAPTAAPNEGEAATLSGVAPPGATVTVYEGDTILGETTADANGNWTLELPALPAGEHTIEATATDAAGQPLGQPTSIALTVQPQPVTEAAPTSQATPVQSAEVSSLSEGAVLVAEAPGAISGVAPPGATVIISEDGAVLGQTTADANGNWQINLPALPPGQHELSVAATDASGQPLGESQTLSVASVPAASITAPIINAPAASPSEGESTTISGVAPSGATVTVYEGDAILGETTADANGNWTLELPALAAGEHTIGATATDAAGQPLGQPTSIALTVQPQSVAAGEGTPAAAATTPPTLEATVVAPEATAIAAESTPAAEGTAAPAEATSAPALPAPVLLSSLGTQLQNSLPTLRGTAAPGSEVILFEGDKRLGETKAGERGNWLVTPDKPLAPGEHQLRIEISAPGAEQPDSIDLNIIISEGARALTSPRIDRPRRDRLGVGNPLSGRAPAGSTVEILDGDEIIGSVKAGQRGRWTFRLPVTLPAGEHSFRIVVRNAEGEVLAESAPITIKVINTGAPKLLPPTGGRQP